MKKQNAHFEKLIHYVHIFDDTSYKINSLA